MSSGSRRRPLVFLALRVPDDLRTRIEAECRVRSYAGPGLPSRQELLDALSEAEGLLASPMLPIDGEVLESALRLRVCSNFGVGFDNVDLAVATRLGVVVCNTPGVLTDAVADLTLALVLSLSRRLPEAERYVRAGGWGLDRAPALAADVRGKTLGIVGLGRIGRAVARRAHAFGMQVCFSDQFEDAGEDTFCQHRELDDLLRESDFVSLHVNLTDETRGLIGAGELGRMKSTAYLINTSRGEVVQQAALVEALREERIAGAALDVLEREPPARDEPILQLPNALILPHIGSATVETRRAMMDLAVENLLAVLRGEEPPCAVNPEALSVQARGGRERA